MVDFSPGRGSQRGIEAPEKLRVFAGVRILMRLPAGSRRQDAFTRQEGTLSSGLPPRTDHVLDELGGRDATHGEVAVSSRDGPVDVRSDEIVGAVRIGVAKSAEVGRIEIAGRPLALDGCRRRATAGQDEVDLIAVLAAPVVDAPGAKARMNLVEDEVFPQETQILPAQRVPASVVADEARVEAVDLRGCDDLCRAAAGKGRTTWTTSVASSTAR